MGLFWFRNYRKHTAAMLRCRWPGCKSCFPDTPVGRDCKARHEKRKHERKKS